MPLMLLSLLSPVGIFITTLLCYQLLKSWEIVPVPASPSRICFKRFSTFIATDLKTDK